MDRVKQESQAWISKRPSNKGRFSTGTRTRSGDNERLSSLLAETGKGDKQDEELTG